LRALLILDNAGLPGLNIPASQPADAGVHPCLLVAPAAVSGLNDGFGALGYGIVALILALF
jgi:hypothetical protein